MCKCQSCISTAGMISGFLKTGISFFKKKKDEEKESDFKVIYDCKLACEEDKKSIDINPLAHGIYFKIEFYEVLKKLQISDPGKNTVYVREIYYDEKIGFGIDDISLSYNELKNMPSKIFLNRLKGEKIPDNRSYLTANKFESLIEKVFAFSCREVKRLKEKIKIENKKMQELEEAKLEVLSNKIGENLAQIESNKPFYEEIKDFGYQQLNWY